MVPERGAIATRRDVMSSQQTRAAQRQDLRLRHAQVFGRLR